MKKIFVGKILAMPPNKSEAKGITPTSIVYLEENTLPKSLSGTWDCIIGFITVCVIPRGIPLIVNNMMILYDSVKMKDIKRTKP